MTGKDKTRLVLIAAALAAVVLLARFAYPRLSASFRESEPAAAADAVPGESTPEPETESAAQAAPDFTVYDDEGRAVSLSDFAGKPAVINFWATWCPPCRGELPDFDAAFAVYGEDIQFLMVDLTDGSRETEKTVRDFIKETGYRFPVFYDTQFSGAAAYGVSSIPMTVFVRADGTIHGGQIGAISGAALTAGLEALLENGNK